MRAKITGLTGSTITFTEIEMSSGVKLIMHGKESAIVELDSATKQNEIAVLEGCKLIKCVEFNEVKETPASPSEPEVTKEVEPEVAEEVEDAPKKKGRGRPKGAKNKKSIKRVDKVPESSKTEDDSRAIVVTENGKPVEANSIKEDMKAPEESEITRASIEALEEMEKEEKAAKEKKPVDEESLDANSQMGRTATVYNGEGPSKIDMTNSAVPESEVAKESDPFIDGDEQEAKTEADKETNAFLDDIDEPDDLLEM